MLDPYRCKRDANNMHINIKHFIYLIFYGKITNTFIITLKNVHLHADILAGIFRGAYISRIFRKGPSSLTLKSRNKINHCRKVGVVN